MTDTYYEITVYTQDDCQQCKPTKIYFTKHGIPFTEINISRNPMYRDALIEQGYLSVPVVEYNVNGETGSWTGFQSEKIEELALLIKGDQ